MKKLIILIFFITSYCLSTLSQTSSTYQMRVHLTEGGTEVLGLESVDSVFFTCEQNYYVKNGALISASYKVSDTKSVYFSQGNLQFNAMQGQHETADSVAQGTWRFAENQYDVIGTANKYIDSTYNGWIDCFGWGTSGWNSGAKAYQPWSISTTESDYYLGGDASNDMVGDYANADWGVYNAISNGGGGLNKWRTLTTDEWQYLYKNNKWTLGYVKDGDSKIFCFMLIPEEFSEPDGVKVEVLNTTNTTLTSMINLNVPSTNTYTIEQFRLLEPLGVVVLPIWGIRVAAFGRYWSSSAHAYVNGAYYAYSFDYEDSDYPDSRGNGLFVRLVQEVE